MDGVLMADFDKIDETINTGKYYSTNAGYNTCNLFVDDMTKELWNFSLPRVKNQAGSHYSSKDAKAEDWPENPMAAAELDNYYEERSKFSSSGVTEVSANDGKKAANSGYPVLVLGSGHATLMAPSADSWPLIYRSDKINTNDKRTRVGIKNQESFKYFRVDPQQYTDFNAKLEKKGFTDFDILSPYGRDSDKEYTSNRDKYTQLRKEME